MARFVVSWGLGPLIVIIQLIMLVFKMLNAIDISWAATFIPSYIIVVVAIATIIMAFVMYKNANNFDEFEH